MPNLKLTTPSLRSVFDSIVVNVDKYLNDYSIDKSGPFVLGLSGGKDSTLAMFALRELGLDVRPAIIDLGYPNFKADAIRQHAADHGFAAECIRAYAGPMYELLDATERQDHDGDLKFLADPGERTPCGACSQSKRRLLAAYANKIEASFVVLAHHRTDAVVTILKDYFIEEFQSRHPEYDRDQFRTFVADHPMSLERLRKMVDSRKAATLGFRVRNKKSVDIVRPLVFVDEHDIALVIAESEVRTFGSGCSHSFFIANDDSKATKRELVHAAFVRRFSEDSSLTSQVFDLALLTVNDSGFQRFNPRKQRADDMGEVTP